MDNEFGISFLREAIEHLNSFKPDGFSAERTFEREPSVYSNYIEMLCWLEDALRDGRFEGAADYIFSMPEKVLKDIRCQMMIKSIIENELEEKADGMYRSRNPGTFFNTRHKRQPS